MLCLLFSISFSQNRKMSFNQNKIDSEFIENESISSEFNKNDKSRIQIIAKITNDSLFAIYLKNNSKDTLNISTQDWHLYLIQEAKDKKGNWKPIEYWSFSWCGNSYGNEKVASEKILKTESKKYNGEFKTQIRFKLLENNEVFYSNPVICNINLSQFEITDEFKTHHVYKNVLKVSDEKLAEKVMFLEPNSMKEFSEKNKIWIAWVTEKNKKRQKE